MANPEPHAPGAAGGDVPDTALFWRWVAAATRPVVGWVLVGAGALVILLGYLGVANEALVAKQLPYLISGGIGGVALVAIGTYFLGTEEIRRDSGRLDRLEQMVGELHAILLTNREREAVPGDTEPTTNGAASGHAAAGYKVLGGSDRYHRPGCAAVEGKAGVTDATAAVVRRRSLQPCPLCEPAPVDA
ncbi:MAG: hypothetical protein NVS1B12_00320 [Acidimicrobiales bacterium]